METELDVKEELEEERKENERLTIEEIKSLEQEIENDKNGVIGDSLGGVFGSAMVYCLAQLAPAPINYIIYGGIAGFIAWFLTNNVMPTIEKIKNNKAKKEEKEQEVEELRRR